MKSPYASNAWQLARRAFTAWKDDAAPSMGAALAFYTLFSLAPVLLLAIAVAGFFMGRNEAQNLLLAQLTQLLGEKAAIGIETLLDAAGSRDPGRLPALIGTVTLALGATTVFAELRTDLDRIWRCGTTRASGAWDFVRTRLLSFGMVITIGFLLLVSLVVSTAVSAMGSRFASSQPVAHGIDFVVSVLVITALFASIFKLLPTARIAWRDVWVGAAITSLLFWIGKFLIGLYVAKAAVGSTFGAAGAVVVVIVWVYYSAQAFFLGAEFTREYARLHGSRRDEPLSLERRRSMVHAANEESMVERARDIVEGRDRALQQEDSSAA